MLRFGSLRARIVVLTTAPLIMILVAVLLSTMQTANDTVRRRVNESLAEAGSVFVQMVTSRRNELVSMAQVTVRDPRFFAPFSIPREERGAEFVPTLEGIAADFLRITDADFMEMFDADGRFITRVSRGGSDDRLARGATSPAYGSSPGAAGLDLAMRGSAIADFYEYDGRIVVAAVAPVYVLHNLEAVIRLGSFLTDEFAGEVKRLTGADVCLARNGAAFASTYAAKPGQTIDWSPRGAVATTIARGSVTLSEAFSREHDGREYLTIHVGVGGVAPEDGFDALIGRELMSEMTPILMLEKRLALGGLFAVVVTLVVGFLVANSITAPLSRIVAASVALQKGQYTYPLDLRGKDEIALLGRNFALMRESLATYVQKLKNLDQAKSNFIALAGHELRTPLTIITGFNEMIASGAMGQLPDKVKETTTMITEQLTGLNKLVQSMLDLTYYEQGLQSLQLARRDVREIVREAAVTRRAIAESRSLRLTLALGEEPLHAVLDPRRLTDAFLALLDNAIRFTADGGTVHVTARQIESEVHVTVEDTGIGIPQHELKWIFEKIYEVGDVMHHSSGAYGFGSKGFGLGLALCKAIVERHGGRITVSSTPGRGSTFAIVLPRSGPAAPATTPAPHKEEGV
ncbi:MAG TPA: HAMP domain-containing sensor histidine kinase, partial [Candidatus Krumholzibacteria bacterium]|nr:HAMP domain-containing sensor histidine kinase [Candidatus Krumholzibacteria bacterium]